MKVGILCSSLHTNGINLITIMFDLRNVDMANVLKWVEARNKAVRQEKKMGRRRGVCSPVRERPALAPVELSLRRAYIFAVQ